MIDILPTLLVAGSAVLALLSAANLVRARRSANASRNASKNTQEALRALAEAVDAADAVSTLAKGVKAADLSASDQRTISKRTPMAAILASPWTTEAFSKKVKSSGLTKGWPLAQFDLSDTSRFGTARELERDFDKWSHQDSALV